VPIEVLRTWLPSVEEVPLQGRQILANDLSQALKFLESQQPDFHVSRMKTLFLEKDQERPPTYSDRSGFFVVSKMSLASSDKKAPLN
jgi:hypothetical protein